MITEHIPVLAQTLLGLIELPKDAVMIDATIGNAGHSLLFARKYPQIAQIIGFDIDKNSLERAEKALGEAGCKFELFNENFSSIAQVLTAAGVAKVDFILADLGWSSSQIVDPQRGLSFQQNMPLDMRLDDRLKITAADIVNKTDENKLADIIYEFGEERASRKIARFIAEYRVNVPINTTGQLAAVICKAVGKSPQPWQIHPATKTFQALRIAVNGELENLEKLLLDAEKILTKNGCIAVISFHSLEDRIVKENFRSNSNKGIYSLLTKKPIVAEDIELKENPRARSAKLRIARKIL